MSDDKTTTYQRDAAGQIERLADYLNNCDAAAPDRPPVDVAIEIMSQVTRALCETGHKLAESNRERDAAMRGHCAALWHVEMTQSHLRERSVRDIAQEHYPTHAARLYPEGNP